MAGAIINGKRYSLVVLRLTAWDDKGRPSQATIGYDDTVFDLADENVSREFATALIPEQFTKHQSVRN